MSQGYEGQDPLTIAQQAERDLHSYAAKHGHDADVSSRAGRGASDSSMSLSSFLLFPFKRMLLTYYEIVRQKFPGADVVYGSAASGAGDNREILLSEGGDVDPKTGRYVTWLGPLQSGGDGR
jgi:hypothetical protein